MGNRPRLHRLRLSGNRLIERTAELAENITHTALRLLAIPVRLVANLDHVARIVYRRLRGKPVCFGYGPDDIWAAYPDTIEGLAFPEGLAMRCEEKRNGKLVWVVYDGPHVYMRGEE